MRWSRIAGAAALAAVAISSSEAAESSYKDDAAVASLNISAVQEDLKVLYKDSKDWWPADYGHYGPFFIRLAWHCSGSYRTSDGRGGCDGGRQRFDPERSWEDNTNLDKARGLLWPIKQKYGMALSWGDLFILAGTTAVETMGGPVLGFCAGRIDENDGSWSVELGPTPEQVADFPCEVNGQCKSPLGSTTVGLIYLNPEGPMGDPTGFEQTAGEIRDTFGRMAMNDTETVALIGGGHSFGKTHGPCPDGPGPSPKEDPSNPWPGLCGTGKGVDAFTSGFEGPWTTNPTSWEPPSEYFTILSGNEWESFKGASEHYQWRVSNGTNPVAPSPDGTGTQKVMMMTSDVSLTKDPTGEYQKIVADFAANPSHFEEAFSHAWYKLTTRDMGPVSRCVGDKVPPPQPWQYPLPEPASKLADFSAVRKEIKSVMTTLNSALTPDKDPNGDAYYGAVFVNVAWQCANTHRVSDFLGGCNGARIRFSPQKDWGENVAIDKALEVLESVKDKFKDGLSWSDLIVLAGQVALEEAGATSTSFCPGRTDATDGEGSKHLSPLGNMTGTVHQMQAQQMLMGLSTREFVALMGRPRSAVQQANLGFEGTWAEDLTTFSNEYFTTLLTEEWEEYTVESSGEMQYKAKGKKLYMVPADLLLKWDANYAAAAQDFAADNKMFLEEFAAAWNKLVTADRFDGPTGNKCTTSGPSPSTAGSDTMKPGVVAAISVGATLVVCAVALFIYNRGKQGGEGRVHLLE